MNSSRTSSPSGKLVAGLIIIAVGTIFLLRQLGYYFPNWLFSWPMILIVIGLINGAKTSFRNFAWLTLVGLGVAFLMDQMYPMYQITHYAWPLLIIGAGLFMILRRNHSWPDRFERRQRWQDRDNSRRMTDRQTLADRLTPEEQNAYSSPLDPVVLSTAQPGSVPFSNSETPEFIDINAVLGGIKRNIFSKNVTGAEISAFMGGAELNFSQADIHGRVIMDVTLVMGGCKLIVPSNWEVLSEVTAILGGIDDKRNLAPSSKPDNPKILVIKGIALMGGIEITSYI